MSEIIQVLYAVGVPMVMAAVYSSLIYRRRALLKGETFSRAKFWGTLGLAGGIGLANYLTNGAIIPTEGILGILEASAGAIVLVEAGIKLAGAKFANSPTVSKLSDSIFNYLIGLEVPDLAQEAKLRDMEGEMDRLKGMTEPGGVITAETPGRLPRGVVLYEKDGVKVRLNPNPEVAHLEDDRVYQMVFPNGNRFSGDKSTIEVLMGDTDAAKAWRMRYSR